ncbi:MAG: ribosome recycling factor, partial [Candidatus Spyradocola sp.]
MTKVVIDNMLEKMNKSVAVYRKELSSMRAGRANPQLLDRITVDYYGSQVPINQVANISIPEPRIIQIAPWEQSMLKVIEKAIQKSDLGINPSNDGKIIRLLLPELTQERRKELVKQTRKMAEDCKVAIRSIRRDANDQIKKMKKDSAIT